MWFDRWSMRTGRGFGLRRDMGIRRRRARSCRSEARVQPESKEGTDPAFRGGKAYGGPGFGGAAKAIGIALAFAVIVFIIIDQRLKPTLLEISQARATVIATQAINRAVGERIARTIRYEDLYIVRTDNRGRVVLMQSNTGEINRLVADTSIQVQEALRSVSEERIRVPMGQVLGSQLLATTGPWISVRVLPVGTVETVVLDRFEAAGINQSRHKVYMRVSASIRIVVPLVSCNVRVRSELPIAESIILGEVPQFYFGLSDSTFTPLLKAFGSQETDASTPPAVTP